MEIEYKCDPHPHSIGGAWCSEAFPPETYRYLESHKTLRYFLRVRHFLKNGDEELLGRAFYQPKGKEEEYQILEVLQNNKMKTLNLRTGKKEVRDITSCLKHTEMSPGRFFDLQEELRRKQ